VLRRVFNIALLKNARRLLIAIPELRLFTLHGVFRLHHIRKWKVTRKFDKRTSKRQPRMVYDLKSSPTTYARTDATSVPLYLINMIPA
jgi:hypothetical protein